MTICPASILHPRGVRPDLRGDARYDARGPCRPPPLDGTGDHDGSGGGPERWVTVATFWASPPAHLARLRLEADGIPAVILDEHVTTFCYTFAFGGIKLQVPTDRLADARAALEADRPDDDEGDSDDDDDSPVGDSPEVCPACGDVPAPGRGDRTIVAAVLLLPALSLGATGAVVYAVALAGVYGLTGITGGSCRCRRR